MDRQTLRVFLGDLPPGITECDVERKVQKYANVTSVELKQKDIGAFAFVDICDTETKIKRCFEKLSSKSWKGCQLRVQKAKESFLDRLARERKENEILHSNGNTSESSRNVPRTVESCKIIPNSRKNIKEKTEDETRGNMCGDSSRPVRGSLGMFSGTRATFGDVTKKEEPYKRVSSTCSLTKSKLKEEKRILQKFEMAHSVWRDSSDDVPSSKSFIKVSDVDTALKNMTLEDQIPKVDHSVRSSVSNAMKKRKHSINGNKDVKAEMRRLKAIAERQKELGRRREAVKFALSSIDSKSNKKIVFDSSDDEVDVQKSTCVSLNNDDSKSKTKSEGKLTLFNEDEMDDTILNNEYDDDFRIRNQFEGKKGLKLLKLQAKYGNDKRFTLDERFVESDNERESVNQDYSKSGKEKMSEVLGGGTERDLKPVVTTKTKTIVKPMLRFDPTKPDCKKFGVNKAKSDSDVRRNKKGDKNVGPNSQSPEDDLSTVSNNKATEETLPVVSKEKFYHVTDSLREAIKNKGNPFSLLEMFGDEGQEKGDDNVSSEAPPIPKKTEKTTKRKEFVKPFSEGLSSSEEEMEPEENDTLSEPKTNSTYNNYGLKQDSFFFELDDPRFLEGSLFFRNLNWDFINGFAEQRSEMKLLVSKMKKKKRKASMWPTKMGSKKKKFMSK